MTSLDITGCTSITTLKLQGQNAAHLFNTLTGIDTCPLLRELNIKFNDMSVSNLNQVIIDMDKGIVAGGRYLYYDNSSNNPIVTETTTNDVLNAYNSLIADGYTITGTAPA